MPNNGKKVSSVGVTLSKEAYLNVKKLYHFSVFYLPSLEDLSLNDFILLIVIGHLQVGSLKKFEVTKYPYSEKTFTAVRVPLENKEFIEKLWKKRLRERVELKVNLSEVISSVLERIHSMDVWIDSFALLYFISFINETFRDLISNEERELFMKKLIVPDFIKSIREPIFSFFNRRFFNFITDVQHSNENRSFFNKIAEEIATACNLKSKEIYGNSLTQYTSKMILARFRYMKYELTGISIIIGIITETDNRDIQGETKVNEKNKDVDISITINSTRKNRGSRTIDINRFMIELFYAEKLLKKFVDTKRDKTIQERENLKKGILEKSIVNLNHEMPDDIQDEIIEDMMDEINTILILPEEKRNDYLYLYPAYFFEAYETLLPILFDSQLAPKSS